METITKPSTCPTCDNKVDPRRVALGYLHCLECGEAKAKNVKHCIVPMPKSNYIVVTDPALLIGLNTSHKGGVR